MLYTMETFEVGLNTFLNYEMATNFSVLGNGMCWFERKWHPKGAL